VKPRGPLETLETLRHQTVEAQKRQLAEARAELSQHAALWTELNAQRLRCEESLQSERELFADARSVRQLRLHEERLRMLTHELRQVGLRLRQVDEATNRARERVSCCSAALLDAERERRAVSQVVEARSLAALKRREQADEDESDDVFRSRSR
jgi:flagellar biosynthesis chaperone FliJ